MATYDGDYLDFIVDYHIPVWAPSPIPSGDYEGYSIDFNTDAATLVLGVTPVHVNTYQGDFLAVDHWYQIDGRIIIKPAKYDFGFVAALEYTDIIIWNNTNSSQTLLSLSASNALGTYLSGITTGTEILARRDDLFQVYADVDGPSNIEAVYQFDYPIGTVYLSLFGERVKILSIRPLERGYSETREYATDIFYSDNNTEYRTILLDDYKPLRTVTFNYKLWSSQMQQEFESLVRFSSKYSIVIPLWFNMMVLTANTDGTNIIQCNTSNIELYAGEYIMIREASSLVCRAFKVVSWNSTSITLQTVLDTNEFKKGDFVCPLIVVAPPNQLSIKSLHSKLSSGTITFEEV